MQRAWREGAQQTLDYLFYSFILQIFNDACSAAAIGLGTGDLGVNKLCALPSVGFSLTEEMHKSKQS